MDAIADKLSAKITDENQIEAKLDELNDIMPFADIAKQDDRLRTLESKSKDKAEEKKEEPKGEEKKEDKSDDQKTDETPAWAKKLFEEVEALKTEKRQTSINQKLQDKFKEKKLPSYLTKYVKVEKEEDIDGVVTQLEEDFQAEQQSQIDAGLGSNKKPLNGKNGTGKTPTKEEIDKILS